MKQESRDPRANAEAEALDKQQGHYFVPQSVADFANYVIPEFTIDPCAHPGQLIKAKTKTVGNSLLGIDGFEYQPKGGSCWLNPVSLKALPTEEDKSVDPGINLKTGKPKPPVRRKIVSSYPFHPMTDWFDKFIAHWENREIDDLLICSPSRVGCNWWTDLLTKAGATMIFRQRVCCWLQQRDSDGDMLPPIQLTSPQGGTSIFLFTRDDAVERRFITAGNVGELGVVVAPHLPGLNPDVEL